MPLCRPLSLAFVLWLSAQTAQGQAAADQGQAAADQGQPATGPEPTTLPAADGLSGPHSNPSDPVVADLGVPASPEEGAPAAQELGPATSAAAAGDASQELVDGHADALAPAAAGASVPPAGLQPEPALGADVVAKSAVETELTPARLDLGAQSPALPSQVPPALLIAVGIAGTAVGFGLGVLPALTCSGQCRPSGLAGGFTVGGVTLFTAGIVWLRWVNAERNELLVQHRLADPHNMLAQSRAARLTF